MASMMESRRIEVLDLKEQNKQLQQKYELAAIAIGNYQVDVEKLETKIESMKLNHQ